MNKEVKALWTAALRSGEYEQTKGVLKSVTKDGEASYCCLGVLCEIARQQGVEVDYTERVFEVEGGEQLYGIFDDQTGVLPTSVQVWSGIGGGTGDIHGEMVTSPYGDGRYEVHTLSALNDAYEYDFNQIADVIDAQL